MNRSLPDVTKATMFFEPVGLETGICTRHAWVVQMEQDRGQNTKAPAVIQYGRISRGT